VVTMTNIHAVRVITLHREDLAEVPMKAPVQAVATVVLPLVKKVHPGETAVGPNHPLKVKAVHLPAGEVARS
jgi:hypothetical protein